MAKKKVVKTEARYGVSRTKTGKKIRMGTRVTYSDGSRQTLLTPAGKGAKAAKELKTGIRMTNEGQMKVDFFPIRNVHGAADISRRGRTVRRRTRQKNNRSEKERLSEKSTIKASGSSLSTRKSCCFPLRGWWLNYYNKELLLCQV